MKSARHRWAVFEGFQITKYGRPYLDRLRILQTPFLSIYLHRIHTPDMDKFPHDHPWWFASLVLSGEYVECIYSDVKDLSKIHTRSRPRGSLRTVPRSKAHQITRIDGALWTLVITGPHHGSWNFWTPDGALPWKSVTPGQLQLAEDGEG